MRIQRGIDHHSGHDGGPGARIRMAAALCLPLALAVSGCSRNPETPNVLLVTLDTTRADRLHCYGHRYIETPHFDALAREGILFEEAVAVAPLTMPAHGSIMTGLTPMAHGVRDNGNFRLGDGAETMAEILKARGYDTGAVIGAYVLHSSFGLAQGFDHYDEDFGGGNLFDSFHYLERPAERVSDAAIRWLGGRKSKRPFFLWVHYYDPHAEYLPPSPWKERYASAPYDGEIAYTDGQLGRIVEELRRLELWDETLAIVIGDHGESLGQHGESTHGVLVYDATIRIPFIMSHPEARRENPTARWKPRKIDAAVEEIDVLPTVAELCGATLPKPVEGLSLLPLLDGGRFPDRAAYSESLTPLFTYGWSPLRSVRTRELKYIRAPEAELYDLTRDPEERRNVAAERPADVERMEKELTGLVTRAAGFRVAAADAGLSEAERAKLASLGYLQGGGGTTDLTELDPADLARRDPKDLMGALHDYLNPGISTLEHGDPKDAEELLRTYLESDPECSEARFYLGLALRQQGRGDDALREFETAQRIAPHDPKIPLHIGILLAAMGRRPEARNAFEASLTLKPFFSEALFALGSLYEDQGRPDSALAVYDRMIGIDAGNATGHLSRGSVLRKLGREEEAAASLRKAADLVPKSPAFLEAFGRKLGEIGHPELAKPLFLELARTSPDNAVVRASLGNCYLLEGDHAKAAQEYAAAVKLAPAEAQYHYLLGCAYGGLRDYGRARAAWEKALELNPAHVEARHNLSLLRGGGAG